MTTSAPALGPRDVVIRTLFLDRSSLRVLAVLATAGIDAVLLKGPSTANWLYEPGERPYNDLDLLVSEQTLDQVDRVLRAVGYENPRAGSRTAELDDHAWTFCPRRARAELGPDGPVGEVDVHYSLPAVGVAPAVLWRELQAHVVDFPLRGATVPALDETGRALVLVLHAARDAGRKAQSTEDLRRLADRLPAPTWSAAAELARRLDAEDAFARGVLQLAEGAERLAAMGLAMPDARSRLLTSREVPVTAQRLEQLARTSGVRTKIRLAAEELWPTTAWVRWWAEEVGISTARTGPIALRARRIGHVLRGTPPAVRAWLRVRRATRDPEAVPRAGARPRV